MIKNKKSQAALEFLTTYGWSILVVMVMIGALAYFGVFNVRQQLPERCAFGAQLSCEDWLISESGNSVSVYIKNNFQERITIKSFTVKKEEGDCNCTTGSITIGINMGDVEDITTTSCAGCTDTFTAGERVKFDGEIVFQKESGNYNHSQAGEIFAAVVP